MAQQEELEIKIGADGAVTVEVVGAQGQRCLLVTKDLEEALGAVVSRQMKSEYYSGGGGAQASVQGS